jgi:hypothetical protein
MATGWERGADGKWRYEVDDAMEFDLSANVDYRKRHPELARYEELRDKYAANLMEIGEPLTEEEQQEYDRLENEFGGYGEYHNSRKLKDYVDAPELFAAYPELRNVEFAFAEMDEDTYGKYLPDSKKILINERRRLASKDVIKRYLVHEIQHAIQHIEGFETGGNLKSSSKKIAEVFKILGAPSNTTLSDVVSYLEQGWGTPAQVKRLQSVANQNGFDNTIDYVRSLNPVSYYNNLSGEVEARNVQSRMNMTPEQRRASLASETEDVAREDQIFLNGALNVSEGIKPVGNVKFRVSNDNQEIFVSMSFPETLWRSIVLNRL